VRKVRINLSDVSNVPNMPEVEDEWLSDAVFDVSACPQESVDQGATNF
jgi:hypothetical protein